MKYILNFTKTKILVLLFFSKAGLMPMAFSQETQPVGNNAVHRISTSLGGLSDFKAGAFLYGEVGYSLSRHISLTASLHRDDTHENWPDQSKGYFVMAAPIMGVRLARHPNGRGMFVQGGIGYGQAKLTVTEPNGTIKTDAGSGPFANGKLGYRWSGNWGRKPTGLFVEALLNYSIGWQDVILQTDPAPAGTPDRRPTIDYHSWNNYKGQVGQTFLIGIGYTW